jgi:chemotaxis protein methyltransferase CheR
VQFLQVNLIETPPALGKFDAIFLRNVMIYFDLPTKQRVLANLLPFLKDGGHFYVGHAETLNGVTTGLSAIGPAIYQKGPGNALGASP